MNFEIFIFEWTDEGQTIDKEWADTYAEALQIEKEYYKKGGDVTVSITPLNEDAERTMKALKPNKTK